jgi:hypothetical protein
MQQIVGALGYAPQGLSGGSSMRSGGPSHASQATVLVSQPEVELPARMYMDLVDSLKYSREVAERRAADAEHRAQLAETRLHELHEKLIMRKLDEHDASG